MSHLRAALFFAASLSFVGCKATKSPEEGVVETAAVENRFAQTDALRERLSSNIANFKIIATIDHSRLAANEGVEMPPSAVTLYSDSAVNTALMQINPRVGLDLPQKALVFEENGTPKVAFTGSAFLAARHGITAPNALALYDSAMSTCLEGLANEDLSPVGADRLSRDYGITEFVSDFSHTESIAKLRRAVMKQGDTVWFGEIDFQREADAQGVSIPNATLLLFGGPKPGGVAMAKFPKLGLDAFCQKLLVYESEDGTVRVLSNNIVALAELHYGKSAKPHEVINGRLVATFQGALTR